MNLYGYLYVGCVEVANIDRVRTYIDAGLLGGSYTTGSGCDDCSHLILEDGETYNLPGEGDTPWSDPTVWASDEFLGILPQRMDLQTVILRNVTPRGKGGGTLGPLYLQPRILNFTGLMMATSQAGMAYGDRWLNEVLSGKRCACGGDEVAIIPACPEEAYLPPEQAFRRLVGAGITDGPTYGPLEEFPECKLQQVNFQLTAEESHLFGWPEECLVGEPVDVYSDITCCTMTAATWSDSTAVITVTATEPSTDIHLYAKRAVTDTCPEPEGEACWEVQIPELATNGVLTVDGVREQIRYRDPSLKDDRSGLSMLTIDKPVTYPVAAACQTLCICATVGSGSITLSVDTVSREL